MIKIYSAMDDPGEAYLLKKGTVHFQIKEGELYSIGGTNMIIGAVEVILNYNAVVPAFRLYDLYRDEDAEIDPIKPSVLQSLVPKYHIGFNLNYFLSRMISMTNSIFEERKKSEGHDQAAMENNARKYFSIASQVIELADQLKFPELLTLGDKLKNELIYETGRILSASIKSRYEVGSSDDFSKKVPGGSEICRQGEKGDVLYILNSGVIDVLVGGNKVASIDEAGSVIGEVALFLGEDRTATLETAVDSELAVVSRDNLESFAQAHPDFFMTIAVTMARRIRHNIAMIRSIDEEQTAAAPRSAVPGFMRKEPGEDKIIMLFQELHRVQKSKSYDQLETLISQHSADYKKYNKLS